MARTPEERREINRRNSQRSTGPKTAEGKAKAQLNALKHGLRAEGFALPGEDQEDLKRLTEEWVEYYEPRSPGERAVLDRCVHATVQLQRCARFHAAAVAEQVRQAREDWYRDQEDELEAHKARLKTEPYEAVRLLKRSSLGCRWMLEQWRDLLATLAKGTTWVVPERELAIRLLGERPETELLRENPLSFLVCFYTALSWAQPSKEWLTWLTDPARTPDTLARDLADGEYPDRVTSRGRLRAIVESEIAELTAAEGRLRAEIDGPSLAGLVDRSILLGGPEGALLARYERMHDTAFHRAYKALLKGEVRHEDEDATTPTPTPTAPDPVSANAEGGVAVLDITAAKADAPNEATEAGSNGASSGVREGRKEAFLDPQGASGPFGELLDGVSPLLTILETVDPPVSRGL
jgi:hypothetical protein